MAIKQNFVGLYIKRFVIPGAQVFNKPGFVDFKISGKTDIYARQIFYPEHFFINLETSIVEKFGGKGEQLLYSVGKRFGYRFAKAGKFENIKDHPGEKIKEWIFIMSKFIEGTYASSIENETDVEKKLTNYHLKRFAILDKLGKEYIFSMGGTAGIMAWLFQEPTIEVVQKSSKKVGDFYEVDVESAPLTYLKKNFKESEIFSETNLDDLDEDFNSYISLNKQTETSCSKSFQTFLDFGLFHYDKGLITSKGNRYFLFEVSGTYLLEYEFERIGGQDYTKILFDSAYKTGEEVLSKLGNSPTELFEFLSALGWGEVLPFASSGEGMKVLVNHFPWSKWYKEVDFLIMRGFLSGALSKLMKKRILFEKPTIDLSKGHLSLLFGGKYV